MGYTHYLYRAPVLDPAAFAAFAADAKAILDYAASRGGVRLAGPLGTGDPVIEGDRVAFNGARPDDYETCLVDRVVEPMPHDQIEGGIAFSFTKTAHRPYDVVVAAVFAAAADRFGPQARFESDGDAEAIAEGRAYAGRAIGRTLKG
jgi:hypothetical protein